jgi:hypothetical protein
MHGGHTDRALIALAQEPGRRRCDLERALAAAPDDLGRRVIDHGLAGIAHRHARHLACAELLAELDAARGAAWSSHLTKLADLGELAVALSGLAGRWAAVKGPVLTERVYGRGDLRSYYDIDLLVHPACFGEALEILEAQVGATLLDRNWRLIRSTMRGELSLELHGRTPIDLHWHLLNEASLRRRTSWDMEAVLSRAVVADVGPIRVPVLDPVDSLVHLATHACLSGAHRMIWLKDIERQQARFPVASGDVEARAREAGLWPQVHLALLRAARTFDLPLAAPLPAWSRLNERLGSDRFSTARPLRNGRLLAAATRSGVPSSLSAAGATVAQDLALPWGRAHGLEQ